MVVKRNRSQRPTFSNLPHSGGLAGAANAAAGRRNPARACAQERKGGARSWTRLGAFGADSGEIIDVRSLGPLPPAREPPQIAFFATSGSDSLDRRTA